MVSKLESYSDETLNKYDRDQLGFITSSWVSINEMFIYKKREKEK